MATISHSQSSQNFPGLNRDSLLLKVYSINWEVLIYTVIFILAVVTRFWGLGERVMSHDESLHTYYSWQLYENGNFSHTPLMHGPLLFHMTAFFYFLFGDNDFSARIFPALLGVAIVMFPYLFRRWMGRTGAIVAAIGLLVSPMLMYYSRYIRHDIPTIFFALVMMVAIMRYLEGDDRSTSAPDSIRRPVWLMIFSGALLLMLASKEVAFFYIIIIGSFVGFYWLMRLFQEIPLQHRHLGSQDLDWQPPDWQPLIGHGVILAMAGMLAFFAGHVLFYIQYAEIALFWLGMAAGILLIIRLIPPGLSFISDTFQTGDFRSLMGALLFTIILFGTIAGLYGSYEYQDAEQEIEVLTKDPLNPTLNSTLALRELTADEYKQELESRRFQGRYMALGGLVIILIAFTAFMFIRIVGPDNEIDNEALIWLLNTVGLLALLVLLWGFLRWISESRFGSPRLLYLLSFFIIYILMAGSGILRTFMARAPRPGVAQMMMEGLARGKSAMMIIIAGTVIGGGFAIYTAGVLDIIEPDTVWPEITEYTNREGIVISESEAVQLRETDPEAVTATSFIQVNTRLGNAMLIWFAIPLMGLVALMILVAIWKTPAPLSLPWGDILAIILVACLVAGIFIYVERKSLEVKEDSEDEPVAIDPESDSAAIEKESEDISLLLAITGGLVMVTLAVATWRLLFPQHWDWLNKQPAFDILILTGTLILPWTSAIPIFKAGYTLDRAPLPDDTLRVAIVVTLFYLLLSFTIGFSWNWRVWLPAAGIFIALFSFFFTTVFTNRDGIGTGLVGSLGYWLEQQGVRRGSQPQYYYTLVQLPVYEFTPLILSTLAGFAGLSRLFAWRTRSRLEELEESEPASLSGEIITEIQRTLPQTAPLPRMQTAPLNMDRIMQSQNPLEKMREAGLDMPEGMMKAASDTLVDDETDPDNPLDELPDMGTFDPEKQKPGYAYNHVQELAHRRVFREWVGEMPFLLFLAYWGVIILTGLTIAGEKMPWLTSHLTIPFTLIGGWYAGRILEKIEWSALRRGGWMLCLFVTPLLVVSFAHVISPLNGDEMPFAGHQMRELQFTFTWLSALAIFLLTGYFALRIMNEITFVQGRRILFAGITAILMAISARAAIMASFENYDYPTEFLVYAHSGDAVKLTMNEIDYTANRTNEQYDLRVAFDDQSSWPMTWYLRHYSTAYFAGESTDLEGNPGAISGAKIIVVGNKKNAAVERIIGDDYYRFDYIRLWWPMQEYFHLSYDRIKKYLGNETVASALYRDGLWDIWWNRDYRTYAQAMCVDSRVGACTTDPNPGVCEQNIIRECEGDGRYDLNRWPVSDAMYVYVDKEIAAEIWDAGIGGESVSAREPLDEIDLVYTEVEPVAIFGREMGLNSPRGIDVGADGRVYVADTENSRILVFTPDGQFLASYGEPMTGSTNPGQLRQPWGVEVADDGKIYVADTWNHRVQVFDSDGTPLQSWGEYGTPLEEGDTLYSLWGPRDIEIDLAGNILVADTGGKRIRVYTPDGEWVRDIGFAGAGPGQLEEPVGLAVNPVSGDIYVADTWNQRIQTFSPAGVAIGSFDVPMWYDSRTSYHRPYIAVSPDGTLLAVSDIDATGRNNGPRVVFYSLNGVPVRAMNAPETDFTAGKYGIRVVAGLEFGADGSLYVLDAETGRVVKFPPFEMTGAIVPNPLNPVPDEALLESDSGAVDNQPSEEKIDVMDATEELEAVATEDVVAEEVTADVDATEESASPVEEVEATEEATEQVTEDVTAESTEVPDE